MSQHQSELEQLLLNLVKNARDKEIEKLATITQKATFDTIEEIVNYPIYQLKDDFWAEIRKPYSQEMHAVLLNCQQILREGFKASQFEEEEFLENLEGELRKFTADYIRKLFKDINTNLLRRFNSEFKNDEKGQARNWITIEEPQIRELWLKCKNSTLGVLQHAKYIEIPTDMVQSMSTPTGGDPQNLLDDGDKAEGMKRSATIM